MTQQSADNCPFPPIIELLTIDSTNNYALSLLKPESLTERQYTPAHGMGVFAHEQFAGKGQRGRTWQSNKAENIHLSVIIKPEKISLKNQFSLIALTALAVRNFLDRYAQSDLSIKWPNDIYFRDRKVGGILIENMISGNEWKWAVVGVGLNINQTSFDPQIASKAVSLKQITGKTFSPFQLSQELHHLMLKNYESFNEENILKEYNSFLYKKNQSVLIEKNGRRMTAIIKEVLLNGQLVATVDQQENIFQFGEISWII